MIIPLALNQFSSYAFRDPQQVLKCKQYLSHWQFPRP